MFVNQETVYVTLLNSNAICYSLYHAIKAVNTKYYVKYTHTFSESVQRLVQERDETAIARRERPPSQSRAFLSHSLIVTEMSASVAWQIDGFLRTASVNTRRKETNQVLYARCRLRISTGLYSKASFSQI